MKKYSIPAIKIASFLSENIVTVSGADTTQIREVEKLIGTMTTEQYKARVASVNNLLQFTQD